MKTLSTIPFDEHFKIETARLLLRPFMLDDLDEFALICSDPEVMRYIGQGDTLDKETVKERMISWISAYKENGFGLLALILKENNKLLGFCGLIKQVVDGEPHIELGYRLAQNFWRQGIATEAAQAIRGYAFNQLGIPYLISIIHVDNTASKRVANKIGMNLMKQTDYNGVLADIFYMESTHVIEPSSSLVKNKVIQDDK